MSKKIIEWIDKNSNKVIPNISAIVLSEILLNIESVDIREKVKNKLLDKFSIFDFDYYSSMKLVEIWDLNVLSNRYKMLNSINQRNTYAKMKTDRLD